jgi:penicillin-binding protein 1C
MMKKKTKRRLLVAAAVLLTLSAAAGIDFAIARSRGILAGIQFSGTYTAKDGKLLHVYLTKDEKYRVYKSVTEYPPSFIEALLLQEDRRFYVHHGINPVALVRAGIETYIFRSRRIGASTITMQTARLKYHLYTKNIRGKITQIFLALRLEFLFSKQEILDAYVNLAPCGRNIEGFETGALYFFGENINKTDLSQQLMLCVLPQNPSVRCPSVQDIPQELLAARNRLFSKWLKDHPESEDAGLFMNMKPALICSFPDAAPHFTRMLETARQNETTDRRRKIIRTTLDAGLQTLCRNRLRLYVQQRRNLGVNNGAVLLIDSTNMNVLADIGSAGFYDDRIEGQVDANISKRSPGSTLKPFIYDLAIEQGIIHYATMLKDTPVSFSEYTPDNYGSIFKGPVKAWKALIESRNIPAITLARSIKKPDLYDFLKSAGITGLQDKDHYGLSIVLGSADVTPFELVTLYAALVNDGVEKPVRTVSDDAFSGTGMPLSGTRKLMTKEASFIVSRMLEQNPPPLKNRPAHAKQIPVAFKTGTSVGFKDCWTIGFFDKYVLCIWIGNFDGTGNNSFIGRGMAAPLFFSIADSIIASTPSKDLLPKPRVPENVKQIQVCSVSGDLPGPDCPHTEAAWFIPGVSPITRCRIHRRLSIDTRTGYRTDETDKPYVKTIVREFWPSDLQALFKKAGLPRLVPPDYPPKDIRFDVNGSGYPPEIISPMGNTKYVFRRSDTSRNKIILTASADADTNELFWFTGSTFIGRSRPGEKIVWTPGPGEYSLTVTDHKGRSDSRTVTILTDE